MTQTIGIIGAGTMGVSLAALFLAKGFNVVLLTRRPSDVDKIREKISTLSYKAVPSSETELAVSVHYSALSPADIVIEAVEEKLDVKKKVLKEAEIACSADAFFYSNTSSLSITELSAVLRNPARFAGMHFFNPPHKMHLVEVVRHGTTSHACIDKAFEIASAIGKTPIVVTDSPGFVINRLLMPFLLDTIKLRDAGVASEKDIDAAVKLGLNHPMGPFELLDLIGLDVFLSILKQLKLEAPQSVVKMVSEGKLGRKAKQGFYNYS